jgi:hypothetical protein
MRYNPVKIRILCATNPKKFGTAAWARFNLYRDGMTIPEFKAAGGWQEDITNDLAKGFISLSNLDNRPDGTAPNGAQNSNRQAAIARIRALAAKTIDNGCTEAEAMSAAAKMGQLMDKYGIASSETEIRDEKCLTGIHGGERKKRHESQWVSSAVGKYCSCRVWYRTGTGNICFFGLPSDVEVATYLMRVIEGSMNRSFKDYKRDPFFPSHESSRRVRNTFMNGFARRVNARLAEMLAAREAEAPKTTTGTSLVVVRNAVVAEQYEALGLRLRNTTSQRAMSYSNAAHEAGMKAGDRVHLGSAIRGGGENRRLH